MNTWWLRVMALLLSAAFFLSGVAFGQSQQTKTLRKQFEETKARAEKGDPAAQSNLGGMYYRGQGVEKNYVEAVKWTRKAADQRHFGAQYNLGLMYYDGRGVEKDYSEAVKWFCKSAEQGYTVAQYNLGLMYANGEGVERDYVEAYAWWNLAAKTEENAAKNRSILERQMAPQQVAEAQKRTKELRALMEGRSKGPPTGAPSFSKKQASGMAPSESGTGFFISEDGYLVTNYHVIKDGSQVRLLTAQGLVAVRVVKVDAGNDLAILKAEGKFAALPVASSRSVKLGATAATVGFPNIGLQGYSPKLARGEIASLAGAQDDPRHFQISVPVQPGNSGGALVNERGDVIGVVVAKLSQKAALAASGMLPENVNYAVKSTFLLSFLKSLPEVAARLKESHPHERKFEDVVKDVERATVLVLVY